MKSEDLNPWMMAELKESCCQVRQEDQRKSTVQNVMQQSTRCSRRNMAPVEGQGGVTLPFVCPQKITSVQTEEIFRVEKTGHHEPQHFGTILQRITKFSTKRTPDTTRSLQRCSPPESQPGVIYNVNSLEFAKACEDLVWNHDRSTLHRSETRGIADRAIRRVKEGISTLLVASGLDERWRREATECYCSSSIQDL